MVAALITNNGSRSVLKLAYRGRGQPKDGQRKVREVPLPLLSKARYALATIRIASGLVGLIVPKLIIKRFGENPDKAAAAIYGLRLFGVRTVLIGADLVTQHGQALDHTAHQAVLIHASDTVTAARLGRSGLIRPATAVAFTSISAVNTVLAIAAWADSHRRSAT